MKGRITFVAHTMPVLPASNYQLRVVEHIEAKGEQRTYVQNADLYMKFPRFQLSEKEIYEVYPPIRSTVHHEHQFPYIQFYKQTLPWMKSKNDIPWMALFVFEEDDDALLQEKTLKDFFDCKPSIAIMQSHIEEENGEKESDACTYIDIERSLFLKLMPTADELRYLAHVKQIQLANKATNEDIPQETISTLLSNQYINANSTLICLLSLEGMETFFERIDACDAYDAFRFPVLKYWRIHKGEKEHHFKEQLLHLDINLFLEIKEDALLKRGMIPMMHKDRIGNTLLSWYHGPLVGRKRELDMPTQGEDYDEYLFFDAEIAMLDVSYSCAYQLGVLLALQNKDIVSILSQIRLSRHDKQRIEEQKRMMYEHRQCEEEDMIATICEELKGNHHE